MYLKLYVASLSKEDKATFKKNISSDCQVSMGAVDHWISGRRNPSPKFLGKIQKRAAKKLILRNDMD